MKSVLTFYRKNPEQIFMAALGVASVGAVMAAAQPDGIPAYLRAVNGVSPAAQADRNADYGMRMVSQIYMAEKIIGVGDGLAARGWENPAMERRLEALAERQVPELREHLKPVYESGYAAGLSGKWSEAALEGYLNAAETSFGEIRASIKAARESVGDPGDDFSDRSIATAASVLALDAETNTVNPYAHQAFEGLINTEIRAGEMVRDLVDGKAEVDTETPLISWAAEYSGFMTVAPDVRMKRFPVALRDPFGLPEMNIAPIERREIQLKNTRIETTIKDPFDEITEPEDEPSL
ncbi:hypothetical protein KUV57_12115 [Epibacterium sp. DP7N7-1]|nr:hypothetical protein [Epibacterium sp. DP7N7-1]